MRRLTEYTEKLVAAVAALQTQRRLDVSLVGSLVRTQFGCGNAKKKAEATIRVIIIWKILNLFTSGAVECRIGLYLNLIAVKHIRFCEFFFFWWIAPPLLL